uniref:Reverse transcriptase Ty1/copia-type domain-containing protein n=1 Tax=Solanum lycopersicum TaxID=4081 RepID=A0A3Q7GKP6_SOLLC
MDDMLIAGSSMRGIYNLKTRLSAAFEMKDLGPAKQILGMKISRDRSASTLNLSQEFSWEFDVCYGLHYTYIAHAVGVVSSKGKVTLLGFMDADLVGDVDSRKRTSGRVHLHHRWNNNELDVKASKVCFSFIYLS